MAHKTHKTRYVRVRLDYVLDMGREFVGLPHEVVSIKSDVGTLIGHGLKRALPRRSAGVAIMPRMKLVVTTMSDAAMKKRFGKLLPTWRAKDVLPVQRKRARRAAPKQRGKR